ncbi:hypothetical protein ROU88_00405 [Macrococcus capreoli]
MINQLKLFLQFNSFKWLYLFLFMATIAFDIFLYTISNEDASAFSPYNMALYVLLMYAFPIQKASLKGRKSKETYYMQPKSKEKQIKDEWKIILFANGISFLFWAIEIILAHETLTIIPLLYVYSIALIMNAITVYTYYTNSNHYKKIKTLFGYLTFIAIIFIFSKLQMEYLKHPDFAHNYLFSIVPFIFFTTSFVISILIIQLTINNSSHNSLIWSD